MNMDKLGKTAISLFMVALMILPLLVPLAPVSQAVNPDRNIYVKPDNLAIVPGQDAVIFIDSQTGAFDPNAGLYVEVEGILAGQEWYSYQAALGDAFFPRVKSDNAGKIVSQPIFLSSFDTSGLAEGTYEVRITDVSTFEAYLADTFEVVPLGSIPTLYIGSASYAPSEVVDVFGQQITDFAAIAKVAVGSDVPVVVVGFPDTASTAKLYWDNLQTSLGTVSLTGGSGAATVKIPESSMGVHAIIAVAQADIEGAPYSFVAVNFVYVVPSVDLSKIIIAGKEGESISITLHGYPAGYHLDDSALTGARLANVLTAAEYPLDIQRNPEIPANGKLTITVRLEAEILDADRGLLDLILPVSGTLPASPDLTPLFTFPQTVVASTPKFPGDEGIFIKGRDFRSPVEVYTGDTLSLVIYNFPAGKSLKVYIGAWEQPVRVTTDANGGATVTLTVPEIPYGTYLVKVVDETTGLVAYKPAAGYTDVWQIKVIPTMPADAIALDPEPGQLVWYSRSTSTLFVDKGVPVKIKITGLAPYEVVEIKETDGTLVYFLDYARANANGVLTYEFATATRIPGTPEDVIRREIRIEISSSSILTEYGTGGVVALRYHPTSESTLAFVGGDTLPVPWISGLSFNYVRVTLTNLIPDLPHKLYIDNRLAEMRNPVTNTRIYTVTATSLDDIREVKVRVPVSTYGPHILSLKEIVAGTERAFGVLIISNPTAGSYVGTKIVLSSNNVVLSGPWFGKLIAGWNFNAGESIRISFAQNSVPYTADANGAFLVDIADLFGTLELPAGTYALSVQRQESNFTVVKPLSIKVIPFLYSPYYDWKYVGEGLSVFATGLDSSRYYFIAWSTSPDTPGEIVGYVQSSLFGTIDVTITTPAGLPGNYYYVQLIPLDNPTDVVLAGPVKVTTRSGPGWATSLSDYLLLTGQQVSIDIAGFSNYAADFGLPLPTQTELLMVKGKGFVTLTSVDGEVVRVIPASLVYDSGDDMMKVVFTVPNDFTDVKDRLFTVSVRIVYVDLDGTVYQTPDVTIAGIARIASGGLLVSLGSVGTDILNAISNLEEKVVAIQTDLGTVLAKLEALNMTLVDVKDGVATLQTSIGEVQADLMTIKDLLNNATIKIDGVMAAIETANATIHAKLDAILSLIGGGQVNLTGIEQGIAEILTELGNLKIQVTDLQTLLASVGDQVLLAISSVNTTLADVVVKKGDEVVATLKVSLDQLDAKVADVNDGIAMLDTKLGTMFMNLSEGQAMITDIVQQNGQTLLVINDAITASTDKLAALIQNGVAATTDALDKLSADVKAGLDNVATQVANAKDEVKADIANVQGAVAEVDTKVQTVQATVGQVKDDTTAIKSDLADVKTTLSAVKTTVDELPNKIQQSVAQSADDVKSTLSTKLDESTGGLKTWSLVNLVLVLVAVVLLAYMLFVKKP
ncbi:MAG: hypothetical protein GSR84_01465 [Desulfurococcales archaeon]|nr:hypothetical protein [Desulfurococcales archaeon]